MKRKIVEDSVRLWSNIVHKTNEINKYMKIIDLPNNVHISKTKRYKRKSSNNTDIHINITGKNGALTLLKL